MIELHFDFAKLPNDLNQKVRYAVEHSDSYRGALIGDGEGAGLSDACLNVFHIRYIHCNPLHVVCDACRLYRRK